MIYLAYVAVFIIIGTIVVVCIERNKSRKEEQKETIEREQIVTAKNKFLNHPLAQKWAESMGWSAVRGDISDAKRTINIKEIKCYFEVRCGIYNEFGYKICGTTHHEGFAFSSENLKPLPKNEATGLCWAVAILMRQYISDNLSQDPSGTNYTLSEVTDCTTHINYPTYSFTYTAPNGNYEAPKDW